MFQTTLTLTSASGTKYTKIYYYKRTQTLTHCITLRTFILTFRSHAQRKRKKEREKRERITKWRDGERETITAFMRVFLYDHYHHYYCYLFYLYCFRFFSLHDERREIWGEWTRRRQKRHTLTMCMCHTAGGGGSECCYKRKALVNSTPFILNVRFVYLSF